MSEPTTGLHSDAGAPAPSRDPAGELLRRWAEGGAPDVDAFLADAGAGPTPSGAVPGTPSQDPQALGPRSGRAVGHSEVGDRAEERTTLELLESLRRQQRRPGPGRGGRR
jgi:hypothetical protein